MGVSLYEQLGRCRMLQINTFSSSNLDKKQIERVAVEYNQMQHLVSRGKGLPFVLENEWVSSKTEGCSVKGAA
jgi:hypothetical protein